MTNRNRNTPCSCGSGLKQKKCHGDPVKIMLARRAYKEKFDELIEKDADKLDTLMKKVFTNERK